MCVGCVSVSCGVSTVFLAGPYFGRMVVPMDWGHSRLYVCVCVRVRASVLTLSIFLSHFVCAYLDVVRPGRAPAVCFDLIFTSTYPVRSVESLNVPFCLPTGDPVMGLS